MDIGKVIGEFAYQLNYDRLPEQVKIKLKTCILNAICIGIAGYKLMPAEVARRIIKEYEGKSDGKKATLFMDGSKVSMTGAVFANSTMFHSRAQEDTLGSAHSGVMVLPVVLAIAENFECTGKEVMEAVLTSYEVTGAFEKVLAKLSEPRGFRSTPLYVPIATAAAAAKLLKLDAEGIVNAVRIAASFAGGITESFAAGTTEWFYQCGAGARNAVLAALLAAEGVKGAESAFDGGAGFMHAFAGIKDGSNLEDALSSLGREFNILDVTFKFWPTCMLCQTPFTLTANLVEEKRIKPDQIEEICYFMAPSEADYPGTSYRGPFTTDVQTTMSAVFNIANAIKSPVLSKSQMQCFSDSEVEKIISRIKLCKDEHIQRKCGRIKITLSDGTVYEKEMIINPAEYYNLGWDENIQKMYIVHKEVGISENITEQLISAVMDLENVQNISKLISIIQRPQDKLSK